MLLMVFLAIGAVSAADSINVMDTEDSNFMQDNAYSLSADNKLEISSEDSISETNIVNSHDDNLGNYPTDEALNSYDSCYEDNCEQQSTSNDAVVPGNDIAGSAGSSVDSAAIGVSNSGNVNAASSINNNVVSATKTTTQLTVSDSHYGKSATVFYVTLKDKNNKPLNNQRILLKVNGKIFSAYTNSKGIATVKAQRLAVGTYTVLVSYAGNNNYASSSLSKKARVFSSAIGSGLTKYYGYTSQFKLRFWKDNYALANTKVTFEINGKTYTKTTDDKGLAVLPISLETGKYVITATNPYSNEKVSHNIVVKKDETTLKGSNTYILSKETGSFSVILKSKHNVLLKNKQITFKYNNKQVTAKTDANGKATISIPVLANGTYDINYTFSGDKNYYSQKGNAKLIVQEPTTKLSASALKMKYNDGSQFKVKLTTSSGKVLANKNVKIKVHGKSIVNCKTNSAGEAKLTIKDVNPGTYNVYYAYSSKGLKDYCHGSSKVVITKSSAVLTGNDLTMKPNDGTPYKVIVKDQSGKLLKGVFVKTTVNGKSYIYETGSDGSAKLKITLGVGYYAAKTVVCDPRYESNTLSKHILVKGTKFVAKDLYVTVGNKAIFSLKALDAKNNVIKNAKVTFKFNGKTAVITTNSAGIAKINLGTLSKGNYVIKYTHGSTTGSSKVCVNNKVALDNLITASKNVKNYIAKNKKIPSYVKIGDVSFTTAEYLYLASKAIVNLKAGKKVGIDVKNVKNPTSPKANSNLGNLNDYLSVAKNVVKIAESKGIMPNSIGSDVGVIGYKGLVDAFSRVVAFYGENDVMPSYVYVKSLTTSMPSSSSSILNSKNTISDLTAYLAASTHCQVNNAQIKNLVAKLTKNCKTPREKAVVIYNYVRDTISYSFYYDTRYGAVGTLNAKKGNCVDHAHLLAAMFRTSGLATRYVHGTCTFSSGGTYGHVWTQVLIGDTWTVADATSARNSFGKVVNWNAKSYSLKGYYSSISF